MKILVIGATGTIGAAIVQAFGTRHEVLSASHTRSALKVDLADAKSIRNLYAKVGPVDAVVSAAGQAIFRSLLGLSDADFAVGLNNKLMARSTWSALVSRCSQAEGRSRLRQEY